MSKINNKKKEDNMSYFKNIRKAQVFLDDMVVNCGVEQEDFEAMLPAFLALCIHESEGYSTDDMLNSFDDEVAGCLEFLRGND